MSIVALIFVGTALGFAAVLPIFLMACGASKPRKARYSQWIE